MLYDKSVIYPIKLRQPVYEYCSCNKQDVPFCVPFKIISHTTMRDGIGSSHSKQFMQHFSVRAFIYCDIGIENEPVVLV